MSARLPSLREMREAVLAPMPAGDFLALGAGSTASPDAALLRACERFTRLHEEAAGLCHAQSRSYGHLVRGKHATRQALEEEIAVTPADTAEGRRAKALAALLKLQVAGEVGPIGHSVLRELIGGYALSGCRS